jgi:ligand-binding sensor domain-containing protein
VTRLRDFTPVDFRIAGSVSQVVRALAEGPDGSLWVGTSVRVYQLNGERFISVLRGMNVQTIEEAPNGRFLIVADNDFLEWDRGRII